MEYNKKPQKLKKYSRANIYRKVYPTYIQHEIPDLLLTKEGYTKQQLISDIYRLIDCHTSISEIEKTIVKDGEHVVKKQLFESNYCNMFVLCSICAEKVSRRRREKYKDSLLELAGKYPYTYMINFSTKDHEDFNYNFQSLRSALRKYVLMGQMRGVSSNGEVIRSGGEASKIKAMALSIEIKKGKNSGLWHVHAHAIAFCDERIDFSVYNTKKRTEITKECKKKYGRCPGKIELLKAAKKIVKLPDNRCADSIDKETGEIVKWVDVPMSKASYEWYQCTNKTSTNIKFIPVTGTPKEIYNQCIEVIKYTSKVSTFTKDDILEIIMNRKGKRYFSTYGELYHAGKKDLPEEEDILFMSMQGYVWSNKRKEYIPVLNDQNKEAVKRYKVRDKIYKAQGKIVRAYYEKEEIKKRIIREVIQRSALFKEEMNIANSDKEVLQQEYNTFKQAAIHHIDELTIAYNAEKCRIFKKELGIKIGGGKDTVYNPTPIQKMFLERVRPKLQMC